MGLLVVKEARTCHLRGSQGKVAFILFLFLWFRATFPRYRYDQLMRLGWKVFIPLTIIWVVVIAVWMQTRLWVW